MQLTTWLIPTDFANKSLGMEEAMCNVALVC